MGDSRFSINNNPKSDLVFEINLASSKPKSSNSIYFIDSVDSNLSKINPELSTTETLLTWSLFTLANQPIRKISPTRIKGVKSVDKMKVLLVILFKYSLDVIIKNFSILIVLN